jgi:general nucleoside transport system ATP-binding protein
MYAVELENITKRFGNFTANDNISLKIPSNKVFCLIGENGAGKSTLMKIIFGLYRPDAGRINVNSVERKIKTAHDAINAGIGMLHQHFMLIEDFTVLENVILGNEISKNLSIDYEKIKNRLSDLIAMYDLNLDPDKKISEIDIGSQQKTELLKLLFRNSDILIFDEPTAVLSPYEVENFFEIIKKFIKEGKTIIFITHKLKEVKQIADNVAVLRKGKLVYEAKGEEIDIEFLSKALVGELEVKETNTGREEITDNTAIKFENIEFQKNKITHLHNVNLDLKRGEIYGLAGVEGNGQNEIIDLILGFENQTQGFIRRNTNKIGIVPDDRIKKGMIKEFNSGENISLKKAGRNFFFSKYISSLSQKVTEEFDVRASDYLSPLADLSGGNQQKVIFAGEIISDKDLLILHHPTRGVDINATNYIHNRIIEERNKGKAIFLVSSDLDELLTLSDRISVIYSGKIMHTFGDIQNLIQNAGDKNKLLNRIGKFMLGIADE